MKNTESKTHTTEPSEHQTASYFDQVQGGDFFSCSEKTPQPFFGPSTIQPMLKVGPVNDRYEQEADQMADYIVGPSDTATTPPYSTISTQTIQAKCTDCGQEDIVQRSSSESGQSGPLTSSVSNRLVSRRGQGDPLSPGIAQQMGQGFQTDFGAVRIHTDQEAVELNDQLASRAFTFRNDIYFAAGEYDPSSRTGKRLLAHELTHVVQQGRGEAPAVQRDGHNGRTRRVSRAERQRLAREEELWRRFSTQHPREAELVGAFDEGFRVLAIRFEELFDAYADRGIRNSEAVDIYERWLRRADQNYRSLYSNPDPFSARKLFLWLRGIRNALHGQHRIVRAFREEVPDDQAFQEVVELRTQVAAQAMELLGLPLIQTGRQEVEGGDVTSLENTTPVAETAPMEEEITLSEGDRIYIRDINRLMFPDGNGGWRFNEDQMVPLVERFVRAQAVQILNRQRAEIESRRIEILHEWRQAGSGDRTQMAGNVRRAKQTIIDARALKEQLEADAASAERLGRLTTALPENYWEILERITEARGMMDYERQPLPTTDYTRQMVIERYRAFQEGGGRGHEALMYALTNDVVVIERRRQAQAITTYMNGIFHQMPFLRYITDNDVTVTSATVQNSVEQGYREALEANQEARRALYHIEPFSMVHAVDAALARIPDNIRPRIQQLIEEERSEDAALEALTGIVVGLGLIGLALIPVVGPELAFAAGAAYAAHEEANMYFQDAVADSSVSPEEDNLGVARPGAFERWMNRLGPIIDVAFAGGGRLLNSMRRPTQAAMAELRVVQVEAELLEAGIRETRAAGELAENAGRNIRHTPSSAIEAADGIVDDAMETSTRRAVPDAATVADDALETSSGTATRSTSTALDEGAGVPTTRRTSSNHLPPDVPPTQIRQSTELVNAAGETHGFSVLSDGRIIRCSTPCAELAVSIAERAQVLRSNGPSNGMRRITRRLRREAREIEESAAGLANLSAAERAAAEEALVNRAAILELEMSDLEQAFLEYGQVLGNRDSGFFNNIEVNHSVAYVDQGGTLGVATREDINTWRIEARVRARSSYPRGNYQRPHRSGLYFDEVGPAIGRPLDRLHPTGPDMFHETPHGILAGLAEINQGSQRIVEGRIRGIIEDAASDVSMRTRIRVRRHPATDFIRSTEYEVLAQRINEAPVVIHRERIDFENPLVHPDVTEADIMVPWSADNINDYLERPVNEVFEEASQRRLGDIIDPASQAAADNLMEESRELITALRSLRDHHSNGSSELDASMVRTINYHMQELRLRIIRHTELDVMRDRLEAAREFLASTVEN